MSQVYMITMPQRVENIYSTLGFENKTNNFRSIMVFIEKNDIHKWIVAKETGKDGYKHIQARIRTSKSFSDLKIAFPKAHIEEASDTWEYERKEGNYITSRDNISILKVRYGELKANQKEIIKRLDKQNDRQITVWYDKKGCIGKSWLVNYMYETGKGFYVPPLKNSDKMVQFVASLYKDQWKDYLLIDIPRSAEWSDELLESLEKIKDGLVFDTRYTAQEINIRGVKICVMTNSDPSKYLTKLTQDRWDLKKE